MIEKAITIIAAAFNIIMAIIELLKKIFAPKERATLQFEQRKSTETGKNLLVIKNIGRKAVCNLALSTSVEGLVFTNTGILPFPQLERGREIVLYYYAATCVNDLVELRFTYTVGKKQKQTTCMLVT